MRLRLFAGCVFLGVLGFAGCGGSGSVPAVATLPTLPAASATMQAAIVSSGTTITLPTVAGASGTLTLPAIANLPSNTSLTLTVSTRPPAGIGTPKVPTLLYVSFQLPTGASLAGPPTLNVTLPASYQSGLPMQAALIGSYELIDGNGNTVTVSSQLRKAQDSGAPNFALLFTVPTATPATSGPTATPVPTSVPTAMRQWTVAPLNQPVTVGLVSFTFTATMLNQDTMYPLNLWLQSGQSGQFTVRQTSVGGQIVSLQSFLTECEPGPLSPTGLHIGLTTTATSIGSATYAISASVDPMPVASPGVQINPDYCQIILRDPAAEVAVYTGVEYEPFSTPAPTPTPAVTPDATAVTSFTFFPLTNDINSTSGQIPVPTQGFTKADLSLPGVLSQVAGTLTVGVGRTNFAPTVFPTTLPGTPLEFVSVAFSQPFSFDSTTAAGLTSDLCFPSASITAASYTFTYYSNGISLGSAPGTIATNDATCSSNTHLSASSTPLGSLPANSSGFGLLVSNP